MEIDHVKQTRDSIFAGRPALAALALYIFGIVLSTVIIISFLIPLSLVMIFLIATVYYLSKNEIKRAGRAAMSLIVCIGWYSGNLSSEPFPPNHIANLAEKGGQVDVIGRVSEEPDIRSDLTYLAVDVDTVFTGRYAIPSFGKVRVKVNNGGSRYDHSDLLRISGYLYRPQGARNPLGFDYGAYLRTKNIHAGMSVKSPAEISIIRKENSFLGSVVSPFRGYLLKKTRDHLSPVSAAILSGFILGERRDIPEEYRTMFRNTGTIHLMAVSGSNVGFILGIVAFPLTLLCVPRKAKTIILLGAIGFFALLTRLEPSVVRASIMASIGLLAYGWSKKPDYINVLGLAGLLMLMWNPLQIFDVGLQLSFAATFAIVYVLPKPLSWLSKAGRAGWRPLRWALALLITTIAVQFAVAPLLARYFNNIPVAGIAANIPIGILAALSMILGVIFYLLSMLGGWAAQLAAYPLEITLRCVTYFLAFFSSFPIANIKTVTPGWPAMVVSWIVLYTIYESLTRRRLSKSGIVAALIGVNIIIWPGLADEKPLWRLDFIDVGNNRAWVYSEAGEKTISWFDFYDGGHDHLQTIVPHILNFCDGRLDYVLTSTSDSPGVLELQSRFGATVISLDSLGSEIDSDGVSSDTPEDYIFANSLTDRVKVVWDKTDNRKENSLPSLLIEAGSAGLAFISEGGMIEPSKYVMGGQITLLEAPWSMYARQSCRKALEILDPEIVVFSPSRLSISTPESRAELTHSADLVYSTSICGGFSVVGTADEVQVRTMRKISDERE